MTDHPQQLTLDIVEPLRPSFDNFVVGRNAEAVASLRAMAEGGGERIAYLWGADGSGRSHLLQAVAACAPSARFGVESTAEPFDPTVRVHLVDDVDRLDAEAQRRLFVLLNEVRASRDAVLVAAGGAAPTQLPLRDDVRTRLAWGLVYQLHALSDDEKAAALRTHAASRGIELADDVLAWLLTHLPRDMRTQVAILEALDTYALAAKRSITVPLIREWSRA